MNAGHLVDFSIVPADRTAGPDGGPGYLERRAAIAARIRPTRRRLTIMSTLATGWLPWGREWYPRLVLIDRKYFLCCGHDLNVKESQAFVDAGLLTCGPSDRFGRVTLVITDAGRSWLESNWR